MRIYLQKQQNDSTFVLPTKFASKTKNAQVFLASLCLRTSNKKPLLELLAGVLSQGCRSAQDRLSIVLSSGRTGLIYNSDKALSEKEVVWICAIVARAAGDATWFATIGEPLVGHCRRSLNKSTREIG
jgi:hypothetical protein